jgi:nitrilase
MPLARYLLYQKGVQMWVCLPRLDVFTDPFSYTAPTADARPTWLPTMQHIAQEGRCFVISGAFKAPALLTLANQYQVSTDFPSDYPPNRNSAQTVTEPRDTPAPEVWSRGGSCIVGPLGEVLAGPLWDREGILYAEVSDRYDPADGRSTLMTWTGQSSTLTR